MANLGLSGMIAKIVALVLLIILVVVLIALIVTLAKSKKSKKMERGINEKPIKNRKEKQTKQKSIPKQSRSRLKDMMIENMEDDIEEIQEKESIIQPAVKENQTINTQNQVCQNSNSVPIPLSYPMIQPKVVRCMQCGLELTKIYTNAMGQEEGKICEHCNVLWKKEHFQFLQDNTQCICDGIMFKNAIGQYECIKCHSKQEK